MFVGSSLHVFWDIPLARLTIKDNILTCSTIVEAREDWLTLSGGEHWYPSVSLTLHQGFERIIRGIAHE